ncbi:sugar kinase [Radiobacillus sp. PE A8.2]|uniref:sugar kinase n=1 Tax=Radiobacillus sp. PE A8.2 TaxID=3380349 RepID=UPI00388D08A4
MDVITIGESMVLFKPNSVGPLRYANSFTKTVGGAESNVAIALARLGHKVGWISTLGDDEFGIYVRNFIRGEGVDTRHVAFENSAPTAVFFKEMIANQDPNIYYYRKNAAASLLHPSDLDESYIKQAKYLHVTGITPALSESCRETIFYAMERARKNNQKVVFDPNVRRKLWSEQEAKKVLGEMAQKSDIILPGLDEGELMTGESKPENIAVKLLEMGNQVVIVKLGEKGAYYATRDKCEYVAGESVDQVVDTAGAGDGFAAGVLSGLIRGSDIKSAVQLGNAVGAFALSVAGDVEGYPFWYQVNPEASYNKINR